MRRSISKKTAVCTLLWASLAAAQSKKECSDAYVHAQEQRAAGKLRATRASLLVCAQPACPAASRRDCTQWLAEVESSLPSVVFAARDRRGKDTLDVRVSIDDVPLLERLSTTGVAVDPGEHVFTFELAGAAPLRRRVVVREGDKNLQLAVSFEAPPPDPMPVAPAPAATGAPRVAPPTPATPQAPPPAAGVEGGPSPWVWLLGGVGVIGLGGFAWFGLDALDREADLRSTCAPYCSNEQRDEVRRRQLYADVSLSVGVLALGTAVVWAASSGGPPRAPARGGAPSWHVQLGMLRGGATATLGGPL